MEDVEIMIMDGLLLTPVVVVARLPLTTDAVAVLLPLTTAVDAALPVLTTVVDAVLLTLTTAADVAVAADATTITGIMQPAAHTAQDIVTDIIPAMRVASPTDYALIAQCLSLR